jgi:hypothetical protein
MLMNGRQIGSALPWRISSLAVLGGTAAKNYASAIGEVYAVKPARIELDHTPGREHLRIGSLVEAATASSFATGERISCGIPGYYRPGQELVARVMQVNDAPLHWL